MKTNYPTKRNKKGKLIIYKMPLYVPPSPIVRSKNICSSKTLKELCDWADFFKQPYCNIDISISDCGQYCTLQFIDKAATKDQENEAIAQIREAQSQWESWYKENASEILDIEKEQKSKNLIKLEREKKSFENKLKVINKQIKKYNEN